MKVHSVNGPVPDRARPPADAPGVQTQADIAARLRPRTDITEKTFNDLPIFRSRFSDQPKALCGQALDKATVSQFIRNSLRSRSLVQEWLLSLGDEYKGNIQWRAVLSARELQKMSVFNIATLVTDALAKEENVAAARISTKDGVIIGTVVGPVSGAPSLTVWHKQVA